MPRAAPAGLLAVTSILALAILPIALLIALGIGLKKSGFIQAHFWPQAERLCYYLLLPCLFVHGLATAHLQGVPMGAMIAVLVLSTLLMAGVLVATRRCLKIDDAAFTSVFQGGIRFNNYIGVSAASGLLGTQGLALAAVANAAIVPTVNVLCVLVFARYGNIGNRSLRGLLRQLVLNPLVLACIIGILLHAIGLGLPPGIEPVVKSLGMASLPLGLLCVGAALDLSTARHWLAPLSVASMTKLVLMPVATVLVCCLLGLHGPAAIAALLFQALPTASSSYIMARQMGGDAPLMAGITAGQTLLSMLALPLTILMLARYLQP